MLGDTLLRFARPLGLEVTPLDDGAWLLQRRGRSGAFRTRVIGRPEAGTRLLWNRRAARAHMRQVQAGLGRFLFEEQVAWTLRELRVNCVLDVGANVGQYGDRLRRSGYRGRIVSFEPLAEFAAQLRARAERDRDWQVHQCALGDVETSAEINATPGRNLSSLLPASEFGRDWSESLRAPVRETVEVRRLDAVIDEAASGLAEPRIYLKLDTQGYDLPAFRGAGARLPEILAMQSEVPFLPIYEGMPAMEAQLAEYRAAGFDIAGIVPVSRHGGTMRVIEADVLLVRGGGGSGRAERGAAGGAS